jgi:hypothetical protein
MQLPDFIVIGAMKCGTSTLHDQLAAQAGFFMSTPKEPNFFSDDAVYARGLPWYAGLFAAAAPSDLRGESSTHYAKRPTHPRAVERMRAALPRVRLVYVMRHPIDRLVSQYVHEWTERRASGPIDRDVDRVPGLIDYGRYAWQLEPYLEAYGPESVLPVFFERLVAHPQETLERIARFVGHAGPVRWCAELGARNVGTERMRRSRLRDALVEAPLLRTLRRRLVPRGLRERLKGLWRMKEKPRLGAATLARLRAIYDEDLARLGGWLGLRLDCDSFAEAAAAGGGAWPAARASMTRTSGGSP